MGFHIFSNCAILSSALVPRIENDCSLTKKLMKTEDICSEAQLQFCCFLLPGFRVFANFGTGLQVLEPLVKF